MPRVETLKPALLLIVIATLAAPSSALRAQTTGAPPSPAEEPSSFDTLFDQSDLGNVAQAARTHLNNGLREMTRGEKLLKKAEETSTPEKAEKSVEKARAAFARAAEEFTESIGFAPDEVEAYAGLGGALRALGQYPDALKVHVMALEQFPDDEENFKGWAETILAMNMLGDATRAYTAYLESHPDRSALLLAMLQSYLEEKRADPGVLGPQDLDRLAGWIDSQEGATG